MKSRFLVLLINKLQETLSNLRSKIFEPHREKTGLMPMRKQRRRSASR